MADEYKHIPVQKDTKEVFDDIKKFDGRSFDRILKEMSIDYVKKHNIKVNIKYG